MNMKKIAGLVAGSALALGLSAPASAVALTVGDLKITINAFDAGTVGYGSTLGEKCNSIASCDAAAAVNKRAPGAYGSEDTWGIFSVQSISRMIAGTDTLLFVAGENNQYMTGMFGGIMDSYVEVSGNKSPTTLALGNGGWLNMFLTGQNYDSSFGPGGRLSEFGYKGITDIPGELALSATFGAGVLAGDPEYTYVSSFANATISGGAQAFLDVTGGSWADKFNTNAQKDPNGNMHDLFMKITYGQTGASSKAGWTVDASGDVQGAIPEPASLALFGLGLAGLALLRRRRA